MSENPCNEGIPCVVGTSEHHDVRFTLIGLIGSAEFQQCLTVIELLHKRRPQKFPKPFIRPMLEFDWMEYKTKAQRKYGGKLWLTETSFIIYANDVQLVSCDGFLDYISQWLMLPRMDYDYEHLALRGVAEMYEKYMELGRKFVYLSISLNKSYVGSLLIMLYYDLLPKTCKNFLRKCTSKTHGYAGTWIHRIVERSWIQLADFAIPTGSISNENYVVPHNRRGVLSMCSNRPHKSNTTQFFITLSNAPWMDYRYVAFGQVMQGDYVLKQLENLPTTYESPIDEILISHCGELKLDDTALAMNIPRIEEYLDERSALGDMDVVDVRDAPSILIEENYRALKYCYFDDGRAHSLVNLTSSVIRGPGMFSYSRSLSSEDEEDMVKPEKYRHWYNANEESSLEHTKEFATISELDYLNTLRSSHMESDSFVSDTSASEARRISSTRARQSSIRKSVASSEKVQEEQDKISEKGEDITDDAQDIPEVVPESKAEDETSEARSVEKTHTSGSEMSMA